MSFKKMFVVVLVIVCLASIGYAQDDVETAEPVLFVGTLTDDPNIFVGLSLEGEQVTIYICDGDVEENTISIGQWFIGMVADGAIDITADNGNQVEVTLDETTATGHFTFADGTTQEFILSLADGDAALLRSEFAIGDDEYIGGWLVLEDGSIRGSVFVKVSQLLVPASLSGTDTRKRDTENS